MLQPAVLKRSRGLGLQDSQPYTVSAPVGGWNVHDPLAAMPEKDAVVLENFFPRASSVDLRPGCTTFASGVTGSIKCLMPLNKGGAQKLLAATDSTIYNVTGGTPAVLAAGFSSGNFRYTNFTVAGGQYLIMCNGVNNVQEYDGTTWNGAPGITGVTGGLSTLTNVAVLKKRLWFTQKDTMSVWYLPAGTVAGAATEFPMGQVFSRGGSVIAVGAWTIDGGSGTDDYGVFVSSEGEVAIYKGSDPASSTTWALVGVYYIGEPVGYNCLCKYGGDLLYLSQNGLFPLSKALQSATVNYQTALTAKIDTAFTEAVSTYGANSGWCVTAYPEGSLILVNIPIASDTSIQYVMNSITGAWCVFKGWNATYFEIFQQKLYFGGASATVAGQGAVFQAWTGLSDNGADIVGKAQSAYSAFRAPGRSKHITLIRPILRLAQATEIRYALSTDFTEAQDPSVLSLGGSAGSVWGTGRWGTAIWGGHGTTTSKQWQTVFCEDGYRVSFLLQLSTHLSEVEWLATDYLHQPGGVL